MLEDDLKFLRDYCVNCGLCLKECEFVGKTFESPSLMRDQLEAGYSKESIKVPYSCTLCGFCEAFCPSELNLGKVILEIREKLTNDGQGPMPVAKKFVEIEQNRVSSDEFAISIPDPDAQKTTQVFFPGCNLSGYSPQIVLKAYDYLRKILPGTGIMLGCCGNPILEIGETEKFQGILRNLEAGLEKIGATRMILACPYCNYTFKRSGARFEIVSLYEIMAEYGLPENAIKGDSTFSIYDACRARWEFGMQDSVRKIITDLGHTFEEMRYSRELTRCCGMGGGISYADMKLQKTMTRNAVAEAEHDLVTYCATCRETFSAEKPAVHVLDLVFNPDWKTALSTPARKPSEKRQNQTLLRAQLIEKFGK